jgi:kynurenine formamidase
MVRIDVRRNSRVWIDVSMELHDAMLVWPGDPEFQIRRVVNIERGA